MTSLLLQAAMNNAEWCDIVCRTQGSGGTFSEAAWQNGAVAPPLYPTLVTLKPGAEVEQTRAVADLASRWPEASFGVKDSFSALDLEDLGFDRLLDGRWLHYLAPSMPSATNLSWRRVHTAAELDLWQAAWSAGEGPAVFRPDLLRDTRVAVLAGWSGDRIVAGGMVNRSAQVTGLSNFFADPADSTAIERLVQQAREFGGDTPVVGWDTDLGPACEPLGPMRVWIRPAPGT